MTLKPLIYAANVSEEDLPNKGANNVHVKVSGFHLVTRVFYKLFSLETWDVNMFWLTRNGGW